MAKRKKTVELTYESFHRLKDMLSSQNEEDRNVALETLSNMKTSDVLMTLLAKSLYHHGRYTLMNDKRFKNRFSYFFWNSISKQINK